MDLSDETSRVEIWPSDFKAADAISLREQISREPTGIVLVLLRIVPCVQYRQSRHRSNLRLFLKHYQIKLHSLP